MSTPAPEFFPKLGSAKWGSYWLGNGGPSFLYLSVFIPIHTFLIQDNVVIQDPFVTQDPFAIQDPFVQSIDKSLITPMSIDEMWSQLPVLVSVL